jgi:hypothetical protein
MQNSQGSSLAAVVDSSHQPFILGPAKFSHDKWSVEMNTRKRSEYSAPKLIKHGSMSKVTQGLSMGSKLDATFPVGTEFGDLTFS